MGNGRVNEIISTNGHSPLGLRATLESAGGSMQSVTVLAPQNDPFRVDTPAGHRDGRWLRDAWDDLKVRAPQHLRGLHYILVSGEVTKPNGEPYINRDRDWIWLVSAAKAARWLGYISFDWIVDQRNDEPVIKEWKMPRPEPHISVNFDITVPDAEDLTPYVWLFGPRDPQTYHLVLVGEKSSLRPVLDAVANRYKADLYLPTGEISDTQAYLMAKAAVADGRPMVVLYFADCDPSGWQMPISLARKLQGLKATAFEKLQFWVYRVGLTPDQVKLYGLPSTPLKDTEKRADKWTASHGVAQTEIDALAALQPDLLARIAEDAISPFYDDSLDGRVQQAIQDWQHEAQQIIDQQTGDEIELIRGEAARLIAEKRDEIKQIIDTVRIDTDRYDLPEIVLPRAELDADPPTPLCSSGWSFTDQCQRLIQSKRYVNGGAPADG
jgi:hypothetical protein